MDIYYTREDVLAYWKEIGGITKTRKKAYVDPRNYLMALLYYKFNCVEQELAPIFGIDRSSINHNKVLPYYHLLNKEPTYIENTEELRKKFPYKFPEPGNHHTLKKLSHYITVKLDLATYNKIKAHGSKDGRYPHHVVAAIIRHATKSWGE